MSNCSKLFQLSLEMNLIRSLSGLNGLLNLMELYVGNNAIAQVREILHLRSLPKLIIVDLSGNPLCKVLFFLCFLLNLRIPTIDCLLFIT